MADAVSGITDEEPTPPGRVTGVHHDPAPSSGSSSFVRSWRSLNADSVEKRLADYHDAHPLRPRRGRLNGDDIAAALAARRAARGPRAAGRMSSKISTAIGVLALCASGLFAYSLSNDNAVFNAAHASKHADIVAQQGVVASIKPFNGVSAAARTAALQQQLVAVRKDAIAVAGLQQQFAVIQYQGNSQRSADNGTPKRAFVQAAAHRKTLAPYFTQASFLVQDPLLAYGANSISPFDAGSIDPRFAWYLAYTDAKHTVFANPDSYRWSLISAQPSSLNEPGVIDVTWVCRATKTGALLAWASAVHDPSSGKFHTLSVGQTSTGDLLGQRPTAISGIDASSAGSGS